MNEYINAALVMTTEENYTVIEIFPCGSIYEKRYILTCEYCYSHNRQLWNLIRDGQSRENRKNRQNKDAVAAGKAQVSQTEVINMYNNNVMHRLFHTYAIIELNMFRGV